MSRRLLLPAERKQMLASGKAPGSLPAAARLSVVPVVRLHFADGTWILSELHPLADDWIAYGLVAIPRQDTPVVFGAVSLETRAPARRHGPARPARRVLQSARAVVVLRAIVE
jgi:Protein of unknown function (DUF2958)